MHTDKNIEDWLEGAVKDADNAIAAFVKKKLMDSNGSILSAATTAFAFEWCDSEIRIAAKARIYADYLRVAKDQKKKGKTDIEIADALNDAATRDLIRHAASGSSSSLPTKNIQYNAKTAAYADIVDALVWVRIMLNRDANSDQVS